MEESGFRSGCPIATTLLEMSPESDAITCTGLQAIGEWADLIAAVLRRDGTSPQLARQEAEALVAALEGALVLARVTRSTGPILNVGTVATRRVRA
jgi:TetR/AcrR family transcriptional repressor of lmrAB and yxaGH operons